MKEIEKERANDQGGCRKNCPKNCPTQGGGDRRHWRISHRDLVEAFGKQGFLSIILPEEYGGTDGDITSFCFVIEEIAKVCGSSSLLILAQGMGTLPIWLGGNPSQKDLYFTQISEKNSLDRLHPERTEGGSEFASIKTTAKKQGKDYLLNGRKCFITNGSIAHLYSVFAVTDPERGNGRNLRLRRRRRNFRSPVSGRKRKRSG